MITVIDARLGNPVAIGQMVRYQGDPDAWWQLLAVEDGLLTAMLTCRTKAGIVRLPANIFYFDRRFSDWRVAVAPS